MSSLRTRLAGVLTVALAAVALGVGPVGTAHAAEPEGDGATILAEPDFKAPFVCGEEWRYFTYDGHGTDDLALDFNWGDSPDADLGKPALASAEGTVKTVAFDDEGGGNYVLIDHGDGWESGYFHLEKQLVKVGDKVARGKQIGTVGGTGGVPPHLHYQVKLNGALQKIGFDGKSLHPYPYEPDFKTVTSTNSCDGEDPPEEPEEPKATELAYTGVESLSNGSPAELSATLKDEDGKAVAKRKVSFALGTGDSEQTCEGTTDDKGSAGCTIDPVKQKLNGDGTVPVALAFAGDDEFKASKAEAEVKLEYVSGRAYGLKADVPLLGLPLAIEPTPDTGDVRTAEAESVKPPCAQSVNALVLSADTLCAEVTGSTGPSTATSTASLEEARLGLPGLPVLGVSGVKSTSTSSCSAQSGSVDLTLTVAGTPVEVGDIPNLKVDLGVPGATLVVNEQVKDGDKLTVNAAHLTAPGGIDIVIASSTSAAHNCAAA